MPIPFFAAAVVGGAIVGLAVVGEKIANALSEKERKRQKKLNENYKEYKENAISKNNDIQEQYYCEIDAMQFASATRLYEMRKSVVENKKKLTQNAYNTAKECLKQQQEDAKEKIEYINKLLEQLKQHENQQQYTPMRQMTTKNFRQTLYEFIREEYAYTGYLRKYEKQLERVFNRDGELLPPFSMNLPESVPYTNKIIEIEKNKLDGKEFDICVDSDKQIRYKAICDDPENTDLFSAEDVLYCLVTDNEKRDYGSIKHLSCAKGMFIQRTVYQSGIGIDGVVSEVKPQEEKHSVTYYLTYQGITLRLFPKDCMERRSLVIGEHRQVYVKYWDYKLGMAQVTEKYEDSLKMENFHTIPLVIHQEQVNEFKYQIERQGLHNSMDDWYIGPYPQRNILKLQLGTKVAFKVHVSLPTQEDKTCYFEFLDFLPREDMFRFNDIFVTFDAQLDTMLYQKEYIQNYTENTTDLLLYIEKQFEEQSKIKNSQFNILYFNQWNEMMKRLIDIKKYGTISCKNIRILEIENEYKLLIFPEDTEKAKNFLRKLQVEFEQT